MLLTRIFMISSKLIIALSVDWLIKFEFKCTKNKNYSIRVRQDWLNLNFISQSTLKAIITLLGVMNIRDNSILYPVPDIRSIVC